MAFTQFYVQSGGSDVAAGSTTNNSAAVTVTNASWDVTANTFIGVTGTEFAAVNVGDWASVYLDAATVAVFIAQVTAVGALGVSITLSTTQKYGTKPSSGATGRSCKVGGAHASPSPWTTTGVNATTIPVSTCVNINQATYTRTASDTFALNGTTTKPLWFRGYNTTPGDCDSDPTLARPLISLNSTFSFSLTGSDGQWSSVNVTGSRDGTMFSMSGSARTALVRMRIENTSSGSSCLALNANGSASVFAYMWIKTPTTAISNGTVALNTVATFIGCVSEGGGIGCYAGPTGSFIQCIALNSGAHGWYASSGGAHFTMTLCTVYNAANDGLRYTSAPGGFRTIVGCAFWSCGGYGINNSSGTNMNDVFRACNDFYSCTSGDENGFGDSTNWFPKDEVAQPYTSSTDLTPKATALAIGAGFAPGVFENESFRSYVAAGAVQPAQASGGSSIGAQIFGG